MNMMPFVDLIEAAGVGVKGVSLFLNMMPAEAESAVMLRSYHAGTPINYELPGYFKTEFQMVVRSRTYSAGESLAAAAIAAVTIVETAVGDVFVRYSRPRTKPVAFPLSKGNLLEFSVTFDVVFIEGA